jgi:hypothetical protein
MNLFYLEVMKRHVRYRWSECVRCLCFYEVLLVKELLVTLAGVVSAGTMASM